MDKSKFTSGEFREKAVSTWGNEWARNQMNLAECCELTQPMLGQRVTRAAAHYAGTFSIHLGPLVTPPVERLKKGWGTWVIGGWGCDLTLQGPGVRVDSRVGEREDAVRQISGFEGATLLDVGVAPSDLSLRLHFSGDWRADLLTDPEFEADQWVILLPSRQAIVAKRDGEWFLRPSD